MEHFVYYYTCDKCGKSLAESGRMVSLILRAFASDKSAEIYDLCPECAEKVRRFITGRAGDPETARKDRADKVTEYEHKESEKGAQDATDSLNLNTAALIKAQKRYREQQRRPITY